MWRTWLTYLLLVAAIVGAASALAEGHPTADAGIGDDVRWLIGIAVTVMTSFTVLLWGAFSLLAKRIEASRAAADDASKELHNRINRVRDEYVKRIDLDSHLDRMDRSLAEMHTEMREYYKATQNRLDAIIHSLKIPPPG